MDFLDAIENLPVLETPRLILRKIRPTDAEAIFAYASRPEVTANLTWRTHRSLEDTYFFIQSLQSGYAEGTVADWGMILREDGRFIGTIGFGHVSRIHGYGEVGYVLHPDCWGRGIVTEALSAVIDFAFTHGLNRVEAVHAAGKPRLGPGHGKGGDDLRGHPAKAVQHPGAIQGYEDVRGPAGRVGDRKKPISRSEKNQYTKLCSNKNHMTKCDIFVMWYKQLEWALKGNYNRYRINTCLKKGDADAR